MYLEGFRELLFISILLNTVCAAGVCNVSASHMQINTILQMKINPAELGRLNPTPDLGEAPASIRAWQKPTHVTLCNLSDGTAINLI